MSLGKKLTESDLPISEQQTVEKQPAVIIGQNASDYQLMVDSVRDMPSFCWTPPAWSPVGTLEPSGSKVIKPTRLSDSTSRVFTRRRRSERGFPDEELRVAAIEAASRTRAGGFARTARSSGRMSSSPRCTTKRAILRGFAKLTRDLSERKRGEENLRQARDELEVRVEERTAALLQANEELQAAKIAAEAASHAKSEFLSRMSHELRTPLNAILGFGQLLDLRNLEPMDRESVDHILKSGHHLLALINEVLDISRVGGGRMELSIEPVLVGEVLREAVDLIKTLR